MAESHPGSCWAPQSWEPLSAVAIGSWNLQVLDSDKSVKSCKASKGSYVNGPANKSGLYNCILSFK